MRKLPAVALGAALALAVAACGSSKSTSSATTAAPATQASTSASTPAPAPSGGGGTISDAADPSGQLKFTKSSLTAKAGKVKIDFTNSSPLPHNMTIVGPNGAVIGATPTFSGGGTKSVDVTLKPGKYTFYCSVDGHRAAGMQGTLTVS
jgi:plastocyanin